MTTLHKTFPGGLHKSSQGYSYFLVGDLFMSQILQLDFSLYKKLEETSHVLGKFSSLVERIPNPRHFIRAYLNTEATTSSRIEGTQTEVQDSFMQEEDIITERRNDWQEVDCYLRALDTAIDELKRMPLCNRVIKNTHKILLSQARGKYKLPGEFRRSQNWIGGSRPDNAHFVPLATKHLSDAMSNLELFIHDSMPMPHLIKAALIHSQFETIHPFLDGNGRIGRMMISLYLLENNILRDPILYISQYLEKHRSEYYNALDGARQDQKGVVRWILFFLEAVFQTALQGIQTTQKLIELKERKKEKLLTLGRQAKNASRLLELLFEEPVVRASRVKKNMKVSAQSAQSLIKKFVQLGLLKEITGKRRNRIFVFQQYMELLE
jgi:Fic family protein